MRDQRLLVPNPTAVGGANNNRDLSGPVVGSSSRPQLPPAPSERFKAAEVSAVGPSRPRAFGARQVPFLAPRCISASTNERSATPSMPDALALAIRLAVKRMARGHAGRTIRLVEDQAGRTP